MALDPIVGAMGGGDLRVGRPALRPAGDTGENPAATVGNAANSFSQLLNDAVSSLDTQQKVADDARMALASGQPIDLHDVTLAVEQASLGLQLGIQVRNKFVESYQEIMRMQV